EYTSGVAFSRSCVEISETDHVTGINGIRVRSVKLLNSQGDLFAAPWKEPIRLRIDIEVLKPTRNVSLGLGITTLEDIPVLTVHHTDFGEDLLSFEPGNYAIDAVLDNPLRMGTYNLLIGAHEGISKSSIFYIPNAIRLEVVTATEASD